MLLVSASVYSTIRYGFDVCFCELSVLPVCVDDSMVTYKNTTTCTGIVRKM